MEVPNPTRRTGSRLVSAPGVPAEDHQRMLRQVPKAIFDDEGEEMLPASRRVGPCRICGVVAELTEEHIPPRGAFNKSRTQAYDIDDLIGNDDLDSPPTGLTVQGGMRGYVLCESCNNITGTNWGREYQEWARRGVATLVSTSKTPEELDVVDGYLYQKVSFLQVYPGRFIRQVISHMLTISCGPQLGERFPSLRDLALGGEPQPLPDPLRIYLNLYADNASRIAGGPSGQGAYSGDEDVWRWLLELSYAPLSTIMLIEGPPDPYLGVDITEFTTVPVDVVTDELQAELPIGFGHKPFPGDFRTKGQLLAGRDAHADASDVLTD